MKIHYTTIEGRFFQHWYDRAQGGNWWAAEFDADASDGSSANQIGSAEFSGTREGILIGIEYLFAENADLAPPLPVTICDRCDKVITDGQIDWRGDYHRGPKHPVLMRPYHPRCGNADDHITKGA